MRRHSACDLVNAAARDPVNTLNEQILVVSENVNQSALLLQPKRKIDQSIRLLASVEKIAANDQLVRRRFVKKSHLTKRVFHMRVISVRVADNVIFHISDKKSFPYKFKSSKKRLYHRLDLIYSAIEKNVRDHVIDNGRCECAPQGDQPIVLGKKILSDKKVFVDIPHQAEKDRKKNEKPNIPKQKIFPLHTRFGKRAAYLHDDDQKTVFYKFYHKCLP
jgi:hypothetical protein